MVSSAAYYTIRGKKLQQKLSQLFSY